MSEIITGRNPVLEALKASHSLNKILVEKNITRHSTIAEILNLANRQGIPVEYVERTVIEKSAPGNSQGIIAYAAAEKYYTLDDLYRIAAEKNEPPFFVILDGIEDPQNMGAILRTADAAGVHGVIIRSRRAVGLTEGVARASAGAVEYVPVVRVTNLAQTIDELKNQKSKIKSTADSSQLTAEGIWVTGIDMTGTIDFKEADYKTGTAIVVGGEGAGLSRLVREKCDTVVRIPMKGKLYSLNASVAAALAMYEVYRQRREIREKGIGNRE